MTEREVKIDVWGAVILGLVAVALVVIRLSF